MYEEAARAGLAELQRLEAEGLLPRTKEISGSGRKFHACRFGVWSTIFPILIENNDVESLLWIAEGGYVVPTRNITKDCYKCKNREEMYATLNELCFIHEQCWEELSAADAGA